MAVINSVHIALYPFTRGKERSRRPEDIIEEVRGLARDGYKEITLLGQNVNSYGKDIKDLEYGLGDLLEDISKIDIPRVRFTTSHPWDFTDRMIEVIAMAILYLISIYPYNQEIMLY